MRPVRLLFTLIAFATAALPIASAITADQLAGFLGVSGWHTVVDLPTESYTIELCEVTDGTVTDRILMSQPGSTRQPERGITIMAGPQDGHYKVAITFSSGGTLSARSKVPVFDPTLTTYLPEKIQEGDFMLFGKPAPAGSERDNQEIRSYAKGFLLRIKKV